MTTNIKEMSFAELNSHIAEFNAKIAGLQSQIAEMVSERETRKEEAINNWKLHTAQVLEDTKILLEMGIDLTTLTSETFATDETKLKEGELEVSDTIEVVSEIEDVVDDNTVVTENEAFVEDAKELSDEIKENNIKLRNEISSDPLCDDEHENPLLTPFYEIWRLPVIKRDKPRKRETFDTTINPFTGKRMVTRTLMPFYNLYSHKPIKAGLKMGNRKYKKTYPDPEETRVVSADGYSPTLTYTHSDFWIWIGSKYDDKGKMISPTSEDEKKTAA